MIENTKFKENKNVSFPVLSGDINKKEKNSARLNEKRVDISELSGDMKEENNLSNPEVNDREEEDDNEESINIPKYLGYTKKKKEYEINFNEHINTNESEIMVNHLDLYKQSEIDKLLEKYKSVTAKDK